MWTTTPPTEPGWYRWRGWHTQPYHIRHLEWVRSRGGQDAVVPITEVRLRLDGGLEVDDIEEHGVPEVLFADEWSALYGGEWWSIPVEPPK